jgi:hypothetical protein
MRKKSDFQLGLEKLLNDKHASPLTNPTVYKNLIQATNQSITQTLKHLGKGHKNQKKEDTERAKNRLKTLEGDSYENKP